MIKQINPPLPVTTPKGNGLAHFLIDNGIGHNLQWVCFLDNSGECWTYGNPMIRAQKNITQQREHISPFDEGTHVSLRIPEGIFPSKGLDENGEKYDN